jgi:hypothetical protein
MNEFVIKNGFRSQGDSEVTGSLSVSGSISTISPVNLSGFATGSVLFTSGSTGAITGSANLFWDNTNGRLGIGTSLGAYGKAWIQSDVSSNTDYTLVLNNRNTAGVGGEATGIYFANSGNNSSTFPYDNGHIVGSIKALATTFNNITSRGALTFNLNNSSNVQVEAMRIVNTTNNVLINTTTDAGYKLDVNGTARVSGLFYVTQIINNANQNLVIESGGSSTFVQIKPRTGATDGVRIETDQTDAGTTGEWSSFRVVGPIFAPTSGTRIRNFLSITPTINQTGGANGITRGLYISASIVSASDWRAIETTTGSVLFNGGNVGIGTTSPSASLHISGSSGSALFEIDSPAANNILFVSGSGNVGIGTGTPAYALDIRSGDLFITSSRVAYFNNIRPADNSGLITFNNFGGTRAGSMFMDGLIWRFKSHGGSDTLNIFSNGNLGINQTTDAGFRLDVNGTARVNNDFTIGSNRYLKAFRWTQDDVTRSLQLESNSNFNVDSVNVISLNNSLLNNTKNFINIGLSSTVGTQSSTSTDAFNVLNIIPTYNMPFGTHTIKGIYYNPTLTAMVGTTHQAFHSTSGDIIFGGNARVSITGSLSITGSAGTGSAIYAYKSGSTVLDIQGSQGQLFSVVDALSGSLMSVNDVSGLPILEVFSDDRVVMGTYGAPALTVSGSAVTVATASAAPTGTVPEGTFRFATVGGAYFIYAYLGGAWRSGSLF